MSAVDHPPRVPETALDTTSRLAARIAERVSGLPGPPRIDELLARTLRGNEFTTLLLHGLRQRARQRTFGDVREQALRSPMVQASAVDARRMHALDGVLLECARDYEAVELAPVEPLGNAACVGIDPNNVLGTARFAEVASDPSMGLALHAACVRRREPSRGSEALRWCASQRVLRLQPFDRPGYSPHFRLFALATSARSSQAAGDDATERRSLLEHLTVWAELAHRLPGAGFDVAGARVVLSDTRLVAAYLRARSPGVDVERLVRGVKVHRPESAREALREAGVSEARVDGDWCDDPVVRDLPEPDRERARALRDDVAKPLQARFPQLGIGYDLTRLQGLNYYRGPFLQIYFRHENGMDLPMGDGGAVSWMQELLSDWRQRFTISGIGSELLVKLFSSKEKR
ncbi:hypothetical protein LVJ94_51795 [Pendulispora rubella]|uniref:Uncharacterized protein n=1 Tax=Pendulispora rubella TaxID=2741070 RepID=A0ABZ2L746_9BACT